jgi:hypothetical protein
VEDKQFQDNGKENRCVYCQASSTCFFPLKAESNESLSAETEYLEVSTFLELVIR